MKIVLNILSALMGLLFINGGLDKFLHYMPMPEDMPEALANDFAAFVEIEWLLPLVAVAEIAAGILIIIPKTRALGALIIFPVAVGIFLTNSVVDTSGLIIALVIWAILIWILIDNRKKYAPLF